MRAARALPWTASVAFHGAVLTFVAWLAAGGESERPLFIDLTETVAPSASPGVAQGVGDAAAARSGVPRASTPSSRPDSRPSTPRRDPSVSAPSARSTASEPPVQAERPRVDTPSPAAARPVEEARPAERDAPAPTPLPEVPAIPSPSPAVPSPAPPPPAPSASPSSAAPASQTATPGPGGGREIGSSGAGSASRGAGASGGAPGGRDGGTSGSGITATRTPGTGDGVDLRAYHDLLRRHIGEALEYPASLRRRGLTGTVELEIFVRADGTIGDVTLTRSSTSSSVDAAALDAVKRLPPVRFPSALPPRALRVRVPVVFDLR